MKLACDRLACHDSTRIEVHYPTTSKLRQILTVKLKHFKILKELTQTTTKYLTMKFTGREVEKGTFTANRSKSFLRKCSFSTTKQTPLLFPIYLISFTQKICYKQISLGVYIKYFNFTYLWWFEGIICWKMYRKEEHSTLVWTIRLFT